MAELFPEYGAWLAQYERLKSACDIPGSIKFCQDHPGTVNNRKHNLQGNCMLHQLAFWGVQQDVLEQFMQMGSDPTLRNYAGETPFDMAVKGGRHHTAQAFCEVFGETEGCESEKTAFLTGARNGDFAACISKLQSHPWLRNAQSHRGWSMLHQAAFHGCATRFLARVLDMGVSADLKTLEGDTFLAILQQHHPDHDFLTSPENASAARLRVGSRALAAGIPGIVHSMSEHAVQLELEGGELREFPRWRVSRLPDASSEDVEGLLGLQCMICCCGIPDTWTVGAGCHGEPHGLCGECRNTWMWAQYNAFNIPLRCPQCQSECSVAPRPKLPYTL